jgi:GTP-binding protein
MPAKKKPPVAEKREKVITERPGDRIVEAEFFAGATSLELFPPPAFSEIAFAGRSNVGKSSLMNCLTSRKGLVRTSSTPGCTRQVSWFRTTSDDKAVIDLVDLPGYGYAKRSKSERRDWAGLIENYLLERSTLRGVVILIDVRRGLEPDDAELMKMLRDEPRVSRAPLELTLVATKLDKLPFSQHKPAIERLKKEIGQPVLGFSSEKAIGRVPLWRRLRRIAGVGAPIAEETPQGEPTPAEG